MGLQVAIALSLIIAQLALLGASIAFIVAKVRIYRSDMEVPYVRTRGSSFPIIERALDIKSSDVVYDLGCGNGRLILYCAKRHPDARFVGIERDWLLYLQARLYAWLSGCTNLTFRREDLCTTDLNEATRIYAFLLPTIMAKLFPHGTQAGLRLVSRAFTIPNQDIRSSIRIAKHDGAYGEHLIYVYER